MGSTPVAMGSSVPAWPTRRTFVRRFTMRTMSMDVARRSLFRFRMPSTTGLVVGALANVVTLLSPRQRQ